MFKYEITRSKDDDAEKATIITNLNSQILFVCPTAEQWFGYSQQEIAGLDFKILTASPLDCPQPHQFEALSKAPAANTFRHKDGYFFTAWVSVQPCTESYAEILGLTHSTGEDNEYIHHIDSDTEQSLGIGRWRYQPDGEKLHWSEGCYAIVGLDPDSNISSEHALFFFQANQSRVQALIRRCLITGESFNVTLPVITSCETEKWVHLTGQFDLENQQVIGTMQDITQFTAKSREQDITSETLSGLIENSQDLIAAVDHDLRIITLNKAFQAAFYDTFKLNIHIGDRLLDILQGYPNERMIYQKLWQRALDRDGFVVEIPLAHRDEPLPLYEMRFSPIYNRKGERVGASQIARQQQQTESTRNKLNYLAKHDPLTGLYNRRAFTKRLQKTLDTIQHHTGTHTLVYLDLDNFRQFNELHGASEGDQLLQQVALTLRKKLRQRDTMARIGGDSFAAILENCDKTQALKVADGLKDDIAKLVQSVTRHVHGKIETEASVGLVPISKNFIDGEHLLKTGQETCYAAKSFGKNRIHVFHPKTLQTTENCQYIDALQRAIGDVTSLQLACQLIRPINSAVWGDHFEVLSRLHDQELGLVMPDRFLPVAEEFDIAGEFDRQVIRKVLHWLAKETAQSHRQKLCTINLATTSLSDTQLTDFIANELYLSQVEPGLLCFELDEPTVLANSDASLPFIQALKTIGCKIALDNVGRAGKSPDYLKNLDVDFVKIDGRLIKQMQDDPVSQIVVESIHRIASATGKQTIASGIENHALLTGIRKMGIHFGQGFGIAQPRPLEEVAA